MFAVQICINLSLRGVEPANHYTDHWEDQIGPMDSDISTNIADINILVLHYTDKECNENRQWCKLIYSLTVCNENGMWFKKLSHS